MVDFGDIIGSVIGRAGRSIDNPYGNANTSPYPFGGSPTVPAPVPLESAIGTLPPPAPVDWRKSLNYFLSEWIDPKTGTTKKPSSRAEAYAILDGIGRTLPIWEQRLNGELYTATGQELIPEPIFDEKEYEYRDRVGGKIITEEEFGVLDELYKKQEKASKDRPQSEMELMARKAIADLKSYRAEIEDAESRWPEDPKDKEPTGPGTQKDPIKVGLQQFMAALAGQESGGGYRPSWASAQVTQGFGPTDEQLDAGYTDDNGVWHPNFNKGLDYGLPTGTPIDAAVGGEVISAGDSGDGWGISVKIRDANGLIHNYGHLDSTDLTPGERIGAGVIIGKSGNTGKSTGPHLSYDVYDENGRFKDPTPFVTGGGYDTVNSDSGAAGRFQIMPDNWPSWSAEAGLEPGAPMSPENQEFVAAYKLNEYFEESLGDWAKVARMWYAGPGSLEWTEEQLNAKQYTNGQEYPSVNEYVNSVMGRLSTIANNTGAGYQLPDGTWVTGSSGSSGSGSSSTYDPIKAKQDKEDRDYELWKRQLGREESRAGEVDRRYDDVSQRMKDYLSAAGTSNDLLADISAALGNEARLVEMNQGIQDDAIATAANVNAAVQKGALNYRDAMAGPIWSNSLMPIQKELEAVRAALQTAPPGFADSILRTIPKSVPMPYNITDVLDLPDYEGEFWGSPSTKRYGLGTIPRYANGTQQPTWREEPDIALYNSGGTLPPQRLAQLRAWGFIDQGTPATSGTGTVPAPPPGAGTTYKPGYVPQNALLPPDLRVFDDGEWLDAAVSKAIMMISSGNSSFASAWGLGDLTPYHGMPASNFDGGVVQALRAGILQNKDAPAVVSTFGPMPGVPTVWVPDPNAAPAAANPGGAANTRTSGAGFQGNQTTTQYGGIYTGGMDAYDSARIALEKEQLALQREIAKAQMKLDQDRFALDQQQFGSQQEYQAAQIRWNDAKALLDEKNFLLQQTQSQLQEKIFEDSIRRYEIETGMAREQLDMQKIKQEADLEYQAAQLELARQSGALSQAEYEEKKRQFELTFNYQKEKDQKQLDIERAKTTVEYLSNPKDAVRSQFWYASQADPVGTAYDLFTGEDRGQKTYGQAYEEDANLFMESMKPYKQYASGSDDFVRDVAAILGDSATSNRATGFEEVLYNPTGAPIMVLNNKMSREFGIVPPKGKQFGAHVREGRAS